MSPKKSFWKDIKDFLEDTINAIVVGCKWLYSNIIWVMAVILLLNAFFLVGIKNYWVFSIIDVIILVFFGIRVWRENRNGNNF